MPLKIIEDYNLKFPEENCLRIPKSLLTYHKVRTQFYLISKPQAIKMMFTFTFYQIYYNSQLAVIKVLFISFGIFLSLPLSNVESNLKTTVLATISRIKIF